MRRHHLTLALLALLAGCGQPPPDASPLLKAMAFIGNTIDGITDEYAGGPYTTTCSSGRHGSYTCTSY